MVNRILCGSLARVPNSISFIFGLIVLFVGAPGERVNCFTRRLARKLKAVALALISKIIFQDNFDSPLFKVLGILPPDRACKVINGLGLDWYAINT